MNDFEKYMTERIEKMKIINDLMFEYHTRCLGIDATDEQREEERMMRLEIEMKIKDIDLDYYNKIVVGNDIKSRV